MPTTAEMTNRMTASETEQQHTQSEGIEEQYETDQF